MSDTFIIRALVAVSYAGFCLFVTVRDIGLWYAAQLREWHNLIGTCDRIYSPRCFRPIFPPKRESYFQLK